MRIILLLLATLTCNTLAACQPEPLLPYLPHNDYESGDVAYIDCDRPTGLANAKICEGAAQ